MLSRRKFIQQTGLASLGAFYSGDVLANHQQAYFTQPDVGPQIQKIKIFEGSGSFYRFIGPNSYDNKPKGIKGTRKIVLVDLSDGSTGIGIVGYRQPTDEIYKSIRQLIGKDIFSLYRWKGDQIIGPTDEMEKYFHDPLYSWIESAILDAIGILKQRPVWQLMGKSVRDGIDTYDGTLYFEEIANQTSVDLIGKIGKRIQNDGYRAIKIKLGRCSKWLPGEVGVERDIEAFIALRETVGTNFNLMADANNGYRDHVDWAIRMLKACAPYDMYFIEELIPDNAAQYTQIRQALLEANAFIPIADGESIWKNMVDEFTGYCQAGVYNFIQPDMPTCGFSNIIRTARMAEKYPHVKLIPHVWQSQIGLLMSTHASKIQANIPLVEDSRYVEHAVIAPGYQFRGGQWFVPEAPGWGVRLSPGYEEFIVGEPIVIS